MVQSLGIDIKFLYRVVFAAGVALAVLAGMVAAPVSSVYPGMGNQVLIICFVVVVIGGIGSIRGALLAALLIGVVDTFGKVLLPQAAGVLVYVLMALILLWKPDGPVQGRMNTMNHELPQAGLRRRGASRCWRCTRWLGGAFGIDLVTKIMIYAIFALSLELLVGGTGLVCFGQAAFFGIGAYAAVLLSPADDRLAAVAAAGQHGGGGAYALAVGALSLRTKGVYFIMVTLAFAQMAYYVVHDTPLGGGTDGIYLNVKPVAGPGPGQAAGDVRLHLACLAAGVRLPGAAAALALRPRAGRHPANEQRMRATGFSTYPYKLAAFTLSGAIAGLAGFLFAVKDGFVNPELMSWHLSGAVLVMIILGGLGHLRGALIGAFAFALLQEFFKSEGVFGAFAKHWHLGLGLTIIASVALLPRGLVGLPALWRAVTACGSQARGARHARLRAIANPGTRCCCAARPSPAAGAAWWRWTTCRSSWRGRCTR
jgi:branched-chain amino acid transport system permease protein